MTLSSADTMLARATQDGVDYVMFMQAEEGLNVQLVAQPEIRSFADLRGIDLRLQLGAMTGKTKQTVLGAPAEAKAVGARSQLQVQF
mgnify:CR=1 FL=1